MHNAYESPVVEYGARRVIISLAVITATLLEIIDVTIVNVSLPNIQGNFGIGVDLGAWIVTAYLIANVVVIPLNPWFAARFGRRQYFFTSIVIFTIASLMCGLSNSFGSLVFWRLIQGLGGRRSDRNFAGDSARHLWHQRARQSARRLRDGRYRRSGTRTGYRRLDHR